MKVKVTLTKEQNVYLQADEDYMELSFRDGRLRRVETSTYLGEEAAEALLREAVKQIDQVKESAV